MMVLAVKCKHALLLDSDGDLEAVLISAQIRKYIINLTALHMSETLECAK